MRPPLVWIIGEGGLLGKQIKSSIPIEFQEAKIWIHSPIQGPFQWNDPLIIKSQLEISADAFANSVSDQQTDWMVLWCAGSGVIGSSKKALADETNIWTELLSILERKKGNLPPENGFVFFSSSAGGVYGSALGLPLNEFSPCDPISDYGKNKLLQEKQLQTMAGSSTSYLIGRISNLYGPLQKLDKAQGLLSHMSLSIIQRRPINIYVPLDTIRDYILASDCALNIIRCIRGIWIKKRRLPSQIIKIFASEESVNIAHIIGIFSRISGHPLILSMTQVLGQQQPTKLGFRSEVLQDSVSKTPLLIGLQQLHSYHLEQYQMGRLAPLPPSNVRAHS